jgi:hypothetical protein
MKKESRFEYGEGTVENQIIGSPMVSLRKKAQTNITDWCIAII